MIRVDVRSLPDGSALDVTDMSPVATERKIRVIRQEAGARFEELVVNAPKPVLAHFR